jgi:hypothetical protein
LAGLRVSVDAGAQPGVNWIQPVATSPGRYLGQTVVLDPVA